MSDAWSRLIRPQQRKFREARARLLKQLAPGIEGAYVVDVGGSLPFWRACGPIIKPRRVRIFNLTDHSARLYDTLAEDWLTVEFYDGKRLPLADGEADYVICNSVIEHVSLRERRNLASEVMRVGRRYFVQTPSPSFPLELHFLLPFVHWLPRKLAREIVVISPFNLLAKVDVKQYFDDTQLLPAAELQAHFPGARIRTERFLGLPKSLIAFGAGKSGNRPTQAVGQGRA